MPQPDPGKHTYLLLNGLRFHCLQWNNAGDGPALVLHHGLASNARIWEMVAPYLAERGFRVFAVDARGHGLSDKPDQGYDFETVTADLAALVDSLRLERPVLAGHSWGAQVALSYAARFPAGPHAPAGLALVDGGLTQMDADGANWEEISRRLAPPRLAGMPLEEFEARLRGWTAAWGASDQALSIILANFSVSADETISPHLSYEHHMELLRSMWDFKTYAIFERLRCPVLAVPARPAAPLSEQEQTHIAAKERGAARAQQAVRDLTVHWMPDTIHDIPLQRPAELARLIADFTARLR